MWTAQGKPEPSDKFGSLSVDEILYEADSPVLFVSYPASPSGQQAYLVYESTFDATEQLIRLVVAPTKASILQQLGGGAISVEQALDQPTVWAVDQGFDGNVRRVVLLTEGLHSVPDGFKPEPGIRLQPDHHYAT